MVTLFAVILETQTPAHLEMLQSLGNLTKHVKTLISFHLWLLKSKKISVDIIQYGRSCIHLLNQFSFIRLSLE